MNITYEEKDLSLFEAYANVITLPRLTPETDGEPALRGKRLGIVNGSLWVSLWSNYFSSKILPGVTRVNVGNDAMQYHFLKAHARGEACPPQINMEIFAEEARQLQTLYPVDAMICTCSTMNRSHALMRETMRPFGVPVVQIDIPMMEEAVARGGRILVVATHGPTVENTRTLLRETARRLGGSPEVEGATVLEAFDCIARGEIRAHNRLIADAIRGACRRRRPDVVVLAQLSMSVFKLSYPDGEREFGVPVLTSAECGFGAVRRLLLGNPS